MLAIITEFVPATDTRAARLRREMRRVNIRTTKPYYGAGVLTSWKTYAELSGSWKEA